jgi:4-hydroxy-2-oxoheptanedioate aldolase
VCETSTNVNLPVIRSHCAFTIFAAFTPSKADRRLDSIRRTLHDTMTDSSAGTHPLRAKLARGSPIAGMWMVLPTAQASGAIAAAGFDFAILDCEHGGFDFATLEASITACEVGGASPLVRVPGPDPFFVQRALDLGADGIMVPQVPDAEVALRAVKMAHFAPLGTRGLNPFTRGGRYGMPPQPKYVPGYPFTGVLVESPEAAAHLARIVEIPALDHVYLGIYDYSVALGIPGEVDDSRVQAFIERAARIVRDAGKSVGTTAMSEAQTRRVTGMGVNVLLYGADTWILGQGAQAGLAMYRKHGWKDQ